MGELGQYFSPYRLLRLRYTYESSCDSARCVRFIPPSVTITEYFGHCHIPTAHFFILRLKHLFVTLEQAGFRTKNNFDSDVQLDLL
jgi:hypothetical protein